MSWHNNPKFLSLQKEWYAKLKAEKFKDVEGGVEGHMLQGSPPSLQIGAVLSALPGSAGRAKAATGPTTEAGRADVTHWYDQATKDYFDKGKEAYYDAAQRVATLSFRTKLPSNAKYTWSMHSDGMGEPVISEELGVPRSRVRRYIAQLREKMNFYLDKANDE